MCATQQATRTDDEAPLASLAWSENNEVTPFVEPLAQLHRVLCPRQVLGVRMALLAGRVLDVPFPQVDKRVVAITETYGCLADGLSVVTGCTVGHRTLRVVDFGKIAATFADTDAGCSIRVAPRPGVREAAVAYAASAPTRWQAQRDGYALMPGDELLTVVHVQLLTPVATLLGGWEERVTCHGCGEEVINGRQIMCDGAALCRHCAGEPYVHVR
jgi:formylmethanofuran dehydrogenase subunit E